MTYQMTTYGVLRIEDSAFIPQDLTNRTGLSIKSGCCLVACFAIE